MSIKSVQGEGLQLMRKQYIDCVMRYRSDEILFDPQGEASSSQFPQSGLFIASMMRRRAVIWCQERGQ
jgi:hypothetical protein